MFDINAVTCEMSKNDNNKQMNILRKISTNFLETQYHRENREKWEYRV